MASASLAMKVKYKEIGEWGCRGDGILKYAEIGERVLG